MLTSIQGLLAPDFGPGENLRSMGKQSDQIARNHQPLFATDAVLVHLASFAAQGHLLHPTKDMAVHETLEFISPTLGCLSEKPLGSFMSPQPLLGCLDRSLWQIEIITDDDHIRVSPDVRTNAITAEPRQDNLSPIK